MSSAFARVIAIALRTRPKGPMQEVNQAEAIVDAGLIGDLRSSPRRGITLLSFAQWQQTLSELAVDLPWHIRRANLLVTGVDLPQTIGKRLVIGDVIVDVLGETEPCELMDQQYQGLRSALEPDCRAGVHGRVVSGGIIHVDDPVRVEPTPNKLPLDM